MTRHSRFSVPMLAAALSVLAGAAACGRGDHSTTAASAQQPPVSVVTTRALMADAPVTFEAGGIVRARLVAVVASRVLAPVAAVHVRPGDHVSPGQPLVELDARQLDADRRRTAAALVATREGATAAEAEARGADAALTLARATRDRIASLFDRRSATPQERDEAEAELGAAEARAAGAHARAAQAAAAVDAARAGADAASVMASYTRITAPFAGVVSERHADPGDMAAPGAPLVTVEAGGSRQLEVRVDEARASAIALHQVVRVRLDAMEDDDGSAAAVTGHVVEIARVDPASHSFVVKIDLPDGATLRSGTFGRAIFDGPIRRALVVPATAVVRRGQLVFVFTVTDNVARLRPISVGRTVDAGVEVAAGILPGEAVVTSPPDFLVDGTTVSAAGAGETR